VSKVAVSVDFGFSLIFIFSSDLSIGVSLTAWLITKIFLAKSKVSVSAN